MPKAKQGELPLHGGKLEYTLIDGVPTINVATSMTTRAQVEAMVSQLDKMIELLPETKVRKATKVKKNGTARVARQIATTAADVDA